MNRWFVVAILIAALAHSQQVPAPPRLVVDIDDRPLAPASSSPSLTAFDPAGRYGPHVIDLGAVATESTQACGAAGRADSLHASAAPVLGGQLALEGRSAAGSLAFVLLGFTPAHALPFPAAGACELALDPSSAFVSGALPMGAGRFGYPLAIPALAVLDGLSIGSQAIVAPTNGVLGFDLTNGVQLDLGH